MTSFPLMAKAAQLLTSRLLSVIGAPPTGIPERWRPQPPPSVYEKFVQIALRKIDVAMSACRRSCLPESEGIESETKFDYLGRMFQITVKFTRVVDPGKPNLTVTLLDIGPVDENEGF